MKAILLAGGKGTRLRPLTIHTPKPIVPIFNRPFLHYQLDLLKQVPEIDEVILSLNYQPRRIEEIFGDGGDTGLRIRYVVEPAPLGTAGAIRYAGDSLDDSVVVFNGDVLTQVDLGGRHRAAPRAQGEGDDRADAGRQPAAPTAWSRPTRTATSSGFSKSRTADEITCNTINAGIYVLEPDTFDRIPKDVAVVDRAQLLPLAHRARRDVRRLRLPRLLDRHRHAGEVHAGPSRHHGRAVSGAAVLERAGRRRSPRPRASKTAPIIEGPCFIDADAVVKAGARIGPYSVIGRHCHIEEHASVERSIIWADTRVSQEAVVRNSVLGRSCHVGRNAIVDNGAVLGDKSVVTDYSKL